MFSATFGSALNIGGAESDAVFDMKADAAGNSYVTGYFSGTVDFDLSRLHAGDSDVLTARGSNDAFIAKYAPDDSLIWARRMGGDYSRGSAVMDVGRSVSLDAAGNVYVAGEFHEAADFATTTLVSTGSADVFVAKFNNDGNFSWAKQFGTAAWDQAFDSGVDAYGNVYALSATYGRGHDVVKFSSNGSQKWSVLIAGTLNTDGEIAVSPSGNVIVAGTFKGTVDFDPGSKVKSLSSGQGYAAFVLNLDANGKYKWVTPFVGRTVGSTWGSAFANSVTLDSNGNVYVGGAYHGTVDFNPSIATTSLVPTPGAFIAKLNSAGGLTWVRGFTGSTGTYVTSIDVDAVGNIFTAGSFASSLDLDPGAAVNTRSSAGDADIFVVKLTSTGNYVWSETFGGVGADWAYSIDVDANGYIHLAGFFADEVDFDPDPTGTFAIGTPGGRRDGFHLRLRQA